MLVALILTFSLSALAASPEPRSNVPVFDYQQIESELNGVGGSTDNLDQLIITSKALGAFVITNFPDQKNYKNSLTRLRAEASSCFENTDAKILKVDVSSTVIRQTSAMRSDDGSLLPECIEESGNVVRASVKKVESLAYQIIDHVTGNKASYLLDDSVMSLNLGPKLDHVHLYTSSPKVNEKAEPTSPLHVDNGMFLIVTQAEEAPLQVQDQSGKFLSTSSDEPGIIVLWGRALDQWLFALDGNFRAAPHFVPTMNPDNDRVIFARMVVAPKNATPKEGKKVTFGDFFMTVETPSQSGSNLCPVASESLLPSASEVFFRAARSTACDEGSAFCWMGCLVLDSQCSAESQNCHNANNQPCCLEGQSAADGCADMDPSCEWHCN